eukprot:scaffold20914_cov135-Isochrysis_galbana.AAC.1
MAAAVCCFAMGVCESRGVDREQGQVGGGDRWGYGDIGWGQQWVGQNNGEQLSKTTCTYNASQGPHPQVGEERKGNVGEVVAARSKAMCCRNMYGQGDRAEMCHGRSDGGPAMVDFYFW